LLFLVGRIPRLGLGGQLRPDLDEDVFDIRTLEKVTDPEEFGKAIPVAEPIIEHSSRSAPPRPVKPSKPMIQKRPYLIYTRKPRRPKAALPAAQLSLRSDPINSAASG
jgi:hypothetical protein